MRSFIVCERIFTIGESRAIFPANETGQQAQQVAGNPRRRRFSTENSSKTGEEREHRLPTLHKAMRRSVNA